jgi:hypothetical protein
MSNWVLMAQTDPIAAAARTAGRGGERHSLAMRWPPADGRLAHR